MLSKFFVSFILPAQIVKLNVYVSRWPDCIFLDFKMNSEVNYAVFSLLFDFILVLYNECQTYKVVCIDTGSESFIV